jgi:hypothetical protein
MLDSDVEFAFNQLLIEFAQKHKQIKAIFKGTHPERGGDDNYHFLTGKNSVYDENFENELTGFDWDLTQNIIPKTENISIDAWPIDPQDTGDYFSGEFIYRR